MSFQKIPISLLLGATIIYNLQIGTGIDGKKLCDQLAADYSIRIPGPDKNNLVGLMVNET